MRATSRDAAEQLRARLLRNEVEPAVFGAALMDVDARDRDAWLDLLLEIDEIPDDEPLPRGCVPYLPCAVASVLAAVEQAAVTADDVFVDVGSGLGRTVFLAHLLTGAGCVGLEIQPTLVQAARERAERLNLGRSRFIEGDAAELLRSITTGTVFFLYCPFGGERLHRVLDELEGIARTREIRVCCVDLPLPERPWLAPLPSTTEVTVYRTTLPSSRCGPASR